MRQRVPYKTDRPAESLYPYAIAVNHATLIENVDRAFIGCYRESFLRLLCDRAQFLIVVDGLLIFFVLQTVRLQNNHALGCEKPCCISTAPLVQPIHRKTAGIKSVCLNHQSVSLSRG